MDLCIGLTGPNASGKGEVVRLLADRGFAAHSLSDVVREEAAALGFPPEREHLIRVGNRLRSDGGPGVLAERILPRLRALTVVDSIRNPAEVHVLRERLPRFVLVGVTAPQELRYRRSLARARPGDPMTLQAFRARERQENAAEATGQQLDNTLRLADLTLDNSGDLERLRGAVERLLEGLGVPAGPAADG